MFSELLDKLGDFFPDGGHEGFHFGNSDISSLLNHYGIDLSMYDADEIKDALKSAFDTHTHSNSPFHGHEISFGSTSEIDARNLAKSNLITELDDNNINTSTLYTDDAYGGLDSYSGNLVYDAINAARDNHRITDSVFQELLALLKKACHSQ